MKTCLFGGSFDPVHLGHIQMAVDAQRICGLDELVFLPAAESPFKQGRKLMFGNADRLAMLRLATQGLPWARVSELDLRLPPPSWSWRLVEAWRREQPEAELYWLLGTDQWDELHRWGRYDYLVQQLTFIVYHRGHAPAPREGVRAVFLEGNHPASSSEIRRHLQLGTPLPEGWMNPACEQYARSRA